tara:strand:+ start:63 stop:1379 length:1317 start_codon:yes stop_codon:yes gene_type:complete
MRYLLLNAGPIAHINPKGVDGPIVGHKMSDLEQLSHPSGMGILADENIILEISDSEELMAEYSPDIKLDSSKPAMVRDGELEVWDLAGRAVVPGLVDAHSHLIWAGDRSSEVALRQQGYSYRQIAEMGGGISHTVRETRAASSKELFSEGARRIRTAKLNGTTFLETKSGYGLTTEDELKLLDVSNQLASATNMQITHTWLGAHSVPNGKTKSEYVEELVSEQLPAVIEQGIARYADVFCEDGWFDIEETEEICKSAQELGLAIRLHVDEFSDSGGAQLASELGAVTADHAAWSSSDARDNCNKAGVIQGFLPGTPYVLGSDHWPPFLECIENNWAWSLASDFNPNCHSLSLPFAGSLAVHRSGVSPISALVGVTRNSASSIIDASPGLGTISVGSPTSLNVLWGENIDGWCLTSGQSPFVVTMCNGKWVIPNNDKMG